MDAPIFALVSLAGIPIGIMSSEIGLKICVVIAGVKKYKSRIRKKKKNHDKIVLLTKSKLNSIKALIYKSLKTINKTFLCYCLKCRKNTESENPKVIKTKNGRVMILSKCAVCNSKNLKFFKEQKA